MHIRRLLFSAFFSITTCAHQDETLGLMIPSEQSREILVFMKLWSILLNYLDLTAMGLHSRETLLNNDRIEAILFDKEHSSLDTTKSCLTLPNLNTTYLCCD